MLHSINYCMCVFLKFICIYFFLYYRGPCVRKLFTGLIMYYPLKIKKTLYCIVLHLDLMSTNSSLTRKARHHRHLLQQFTGQWRKVYLLNLRERHSQISSNRKGADIVVGDVVILKNDSTNRMFWKLAKVELLLTRKDGIVRAALIKVSNSHRIP